MQKGKAIIFSAPSGSGKTTIVKNLLKEIPELRFSISATSRPPRQGEINGKDYHFLKKEDFLSRISKNEFVEWEEVYEHVLYGTLKSEIDAIWQNGNPVIFDVDVKGGLSLKKYFGAQALAIFVKVPDIKTLETRLDKRGSETPDTLKKRIDKATYEMTFEKEFDETLLNVELETTFNTSVLLVREFLKPND